MRPLLPLTALVVAAGLSVFPDAYLAPGATQFTVTAGTPRTYTWNASKSQGNYAFSIYGPDGFVRTFRGQVIQAGRNNVALPAVTAQDQPGTTATVAFSLSNAGQTAVRFVLTPNDYAGTTQEIWVNGGANTTVTWPTDPDGYYDVVITAPSGTGFTARYAGQVIQRIGSPPARAGGGKPARSRKP